MAEKLVSGDRCTARAACRHFGLHRSTYAYRAKEADAWEAKLKGALRRKSNEHPELGYAKITRLLKQEGWQVGLVTFRGCGGSLDWRCRRKSPSAGDRAYLRVFRPRVSIVGMSGRGILFMTRRSEGANCECSISSMSIPGSACVSMWIGRSTPVK